MLHQSIDAADATPADCPIRRELAVLSAGLDTRFLHAGSTLATAIGMIDRLTGGLDGIVEALDARTAGVAVTDLRNVAERLTALPVAQEARMAHLGAVAEIADTLRAHVLDMHQTLRILGIYGMNIKIAASGQEHFVGFVESMKGRLAAGEQQLGAVMLKLADLTEGVAGMQRVDRLLATECARVVPAVPQRLDDDAVALSAYLDTVATLARRVAAIARSVQAKVAVVLGALQVGDSTRQRLEHVVSALQMVESQGAGPGAAAHVDRLLAAQLDATMQDFARETAALIDSLTDLGPDTDALLELIVEQADGNGRAFLARLDQGVTDMGSVTGQLRDAEARAQEMAIVVADTVADLTQRVGDLDRVQLDVQDIATNTRLLCRRHGMVGRAVAVVATEVDIHSRALGKTGTGVRDAIAQLETLQADTVDRDTSATRDMGAVLNDALAVIRRACQRTEQVAMTGGGDARQLGELIATIAGELRSELAVRDVMAAAAATLLARAATAPAGEIATDDAMLRDLLPSIARLYTMAQERDVHDHFLLPGMAVTATVEEVDDDDDDGLF